MKKIVFSLLLFCSAGAINAQVMSAKPQWATLNVPQLKCWECKDRLDKYLLHETGPNGDNGIVKWTANMASGTLKIEYVPDRITLDYIKTAINNAGFDVDSTTATPDAYKMLPPICKRASEGGGQIKGQPPCKLPPDQRQ
jgi:mercuric ion binding protein